MLDTRSKEALLSAAVILVILGVLLIVANGLELANERLLKIGCVNIVAGIGLGIFSGTTGILSLGHVMFFGVGAYVASWFTLPTMMKSIMLPNMPGFIADNQYPLAVAVIPATLAAILIGVLTGPVMGRLRDTSAVIASFGFMVISYLLFIGLKPLTNGKQSLYGLPPKALTWPLLLTILALVILVAFYIKSTRLSRAAEVVRDNELAAKAIGIRPNFCIFYMWVISAGFMGLAGALFAHAIGVVAPGSFYLEKTFALMVIIILGGYRSLTGCITGAVLVTILEEILKNIEEWLGEYRGEEIFGLFTMPPVFGFTALGFSVIILMVFYLRPDGVAGYRELASYGRIARRFQGWLYKRPNSFKPQFFQVDPDAQLQTEALGKSYGAFLAMDKVNIKVSSGEIVGLIGSNGAGKSTFVNVISGALFASHGNIWVGKEDATLWSASKLARQGLGRTFQNIRIFPSLTVLENAIAAINVIHPGLGRVEAEDKSWGWIHHLNLDEFAYELASTLSYGDQRRLEIARALALEPQFLLLDEPAAGMNHAETQALKDLLREIVDRIGCGIIIVEHDLPMVMELCERIYVLNKGEQIASGTPKEVRKDHGVIEAYIGDEPV